MLKRQANIPLEEIDFGNRKRQEYGNLEELAEEIQEVGLIHPVTVVDKSKLDEKALENLATNDAPYLLLAGGRRTKTFMEYDLGDIPAYVYPHLLNEYEIRKIELMENVSRKELTWLEDSQLTAEIHELEQKIKGTAHTSSGGHSLKDTAKLLNKSKSSVKNEIDLAEAVKHLPHLANIKSKTEALKVARQVFKSGVAENAAKSAREKLSKNGEKGVKQELMNTFVCGDFFEHAEKLPDRTFDLIEIDPPYGIDLSNVKKESKHMTLNYNEVPAEEYKNFMRRTFLYAKKLLKPNGWLVCWYAISPWHATMVELLEEIGFKTNALPALWIKNGGQTNRPKHYFGSCYEPFLYARLSESARLNKPGVANYLIHPKVSPESKIHPTQRPIELMEDVITRFTNNGKILIPFAGSGVTLRAAHNLNMNAVGYDLSQDAKNKFDVLVNNHDMNEKFTL